MDRKEHASRLAALQRQKNEGTALGEAEQLRLRNTIGSNNAKSDDDSLANCWPTPVAAEVELLASMEMPSLALPRRRAGDPTYNQQLQLNLDIAELPDDKGWSGLTRQQVRIGCVHLCITLVALAAPCIGSTLWKRVRSVPSFPLSPQLCRLQNSPMALNVARQELLGGLMSSVDVAVAATAVSSEGEVHLDTTEKLSPLAHHSITSPITGAQG